jgi:hypothetical protein
LAPEIFNGVQIRRLHRPLQLFKFMLFLHNPQCTGALSSI